MKQEILLPNNFDDLVTEAVEVFWKTRDGGSGTQAGGRGNVIGGKNLDGFIGLVSHVADHCGLPEQCVFTHGRSVLALPGFYRPLKNWDALVIHNNRLVAVFEFKSHVGPSFGNNFNNRAEEALGNALDLKAAQSAGTYHPNNHVSTLDTSMSVDPRPPFTGYLMLLEEAEGSTRSVQVGSAHYRIRSEFEQASYAKRYQILCERLMGEGLYSAAALMLTDRQQGRANGNAHALSEPTSVRSLFREFAARAVAAR